jgi:hypothetical protein
MGEPWSRHMLSNGKVLALQTGWADVTAPVAHKVATSREVLPGRQDLLKTPNGNRRIRVDRLVPIRVERAIYSLCQMT